MTHVCSFGAFSTYIWIFSFLLTTIMSNFPSLQGFLASVPETPDPPIPNKDDKDYEPAPYEVAVASYHALNQRASLSIPPPPTDPNIVHPNVREAIKADSNVGTCLNAMPSSYDPVTKFHTMISALFSLWLQLEKYVGPLILDQAKLSLAAICNIAEPFAHPAPEPIWVNDPPVVIPPTPGTPPAQVADAVMAKASPDCAVTLTPHLKEKGKMKAKAMPSSAPPPSLPPTAQPSATLAQAPKAPNATHKAYASHAPPPPLSYAKVAAPRPTQPKLVIRPSLMISLHNPQHHSTLQSLAMLQVHCLVEICNEVLKSKACYPSVRVSATKWAPLSNLVVFAGPDTTFTQLQSAHHLMTLAIKGTLPGTISLSSCPNVKWSKILIGSMPTGVTDHISQAHSHEECHQALLHDNPFYHCL